MSVSTVHTPNTATSSCTTIAVPVKASATESPTQHIADRLSKQASVDCCLLAPKRKTVTELRNSDDNSRFIRRRLDPSLCIPSIEGIEENSGQVRRNADVIGSASPFRSSDLIGSVLRIANGARASDWDGTLAFPVLAAPVGATTVSQVRPAASGSNPYARLKPRSTSSQRAHSVDIGQPRNSQFRPILEPAYTSKTTDPTSDSNRGLSILSIAMNKH